MDPQVGHAGGASVRAGAISVLTAILRAQNLLVRVYRTRDPQTFTAPHPAPGTPDFYRTPPRDADLVWAVAQTLQELDKAGVAAHYEDDFVRVPGGRVVVRHPVAEDDVRASTELPPEEVELAVWRLVEETNGGMEDELPRAIRDLFGFKRLGPRLQSAVQRASEDLEATGCLERDASGRLRAVTPPVPPT